jgi:hypothetical protein
MNSGFRGRWDRNRTGTLRLWRPVVRRKIPLTVASPTSEGGPLSREDAHRPRPSSLARGREPAGRVALWRFTFDLTIPAHEQTTRAHALRHTLPEIVLQLPLEAA